LIADLISSHFPLPPTTQQQGAFHRIADFLTHKDPTCCFVLRGYAGTGKTTIISTLVKILPQLHMKSVLLAPTGRAAKVMGNYYCKKALAIHKKIYWKKAAVGPDLSFGMADNLHSDTLFNVDEASMISNER